MLHIHPLTLEDILQQDPREKLEIFGKLGYYFISFRAIESQATRDKIRREVGLREGYDENSIGEANVYLTVFKSGICCVRPINSTCLDFSHKVAVPFYRCIRTYRPCTQQNGAARTSGHLVVRCGLPVVYNTHMINLHKDWIAHGILDSIVDSFFPVLNEIEKEVTAIDYLVYNIGNLDPIASPAPSLNSDDTLLNRQTSGEQRRIPIKQGSDTFYTPAEKLRDAYRPRFVSPRLSPRLLSRRLKRHISYAWNALWVRAEPPPSERQETLRRMARTRKQVTVLGRLLATKADVVTHIRKRLSKAGSEMPGSDELEVAIYMGDVEGVYILSKLSAV